TGSWKTSGGATPYGDISLYSKDYGATYSFESSLTGVIEISLWWTEWSSRSSNVPVRIYDGTELLDTIYVDQFSNGGQWNLLGRYTFTQAASVVVVSDGTSSSTCADAAKFNIYSEITDPYTTIVIDNGDDNSSSTGSWKISGGANPYGENSLYSRDYGATYSFESSLTGDLDLSLWWTTYKSRCTSVPIDIYDGSEFVDTVYINQQTDGGQWYFLGLYHFDYSAEVVIVSEGDDCSTSADAVMIEQAN
ncbi:MAG: hypothetical protein PVH22_15440, partial [Desulfobacteraceae bacterium]